MRAHTAGRRVLAGVRALARLLRAIAGAPDYDRYVAHMRLHHPGVAPLSPRAFTEQRWAERYARPGSRCC